MATQANKLVVLLQYGTIRHIPKEDVLKQGYPIPVKVEHQLYRYILKRKYRDTFGFIKMEMAIDPNKFSHFISTIYNMIKP